MEAVEAVVVVGVSATADGTQEVELEARFPAADFERANVVVSCRRRRGACSQAIRRWWSFSIPASRPGRIARGRATRPSETPTAPGFCLP